MGLVNATKRTYLKLLGSPLHRLDSSHGLVLHRQLQDVIQDPWARVAPGGTIKQSRNAAALHLLDRDIAAYAMVVDKNSDIWLNLRRVHYSFLFSSQFSPDYFADPGSGG